MIVDPNRQLLLLVAKALGSLCDEVVFVGGCAAGLLMTIARAQMIRPTDDVDFIVHVISKADYHAIEQQLRDKGFKQNLSSHAPICRWNYQGVAVDVMPTDASILGFSNRWYTTAIEHSLTVDLDHDTQINLISAPLFIATKLEAFLGRGRGDIAMSHDLEDIVSVIDGRPEILDEISQEKETVRTYIATQMADLLANTEFKVALSGFLPADAASQARLPALIEKITAMATM